jgi:hypothetical protein
MGRDVIGAASPIGSSCPVAMLDTRIDSVRKEKNVVFIMLNVSVAPS